MHFFLRKKRDISNIGRIYANFGIIARKRMCVKEKKDNITALKERLFVHKSKRNYRFPKCSANGLEKCVG